MDADVITPEGYEELKRELDQLWRVERPEITKVVRWAAGLGDRSENADYQYNKKRLREIDRRVRYLRKRLEVLRIVEYHPAQEGKAFFGAWVELIGHNEKQIKFRIIGPDEIHRNKNYASVNAPIVKACLGKSIGDKFSVENPNSVDVWEISCIRYFHK